MLLLKCLLALLVLNVTPNKPFVGFILERLWSILGEFMSGVWPFHLNTQYEETLKLCLWKNQCYWIHCPFYVSHVLWKERHVKTNKSTLKFSSRYQTKLSMKQCFCFCTVGRVKLHFENMLFRRQIVVLGYSFLTRGWWKYMISCAAEWLHLNCDEPDFY